MTRRWTTDQVAEMLDFSCGGRFGATSPMIQMQTEGVAAICEILRKRHVAYLADEVGLGKTMQGLGVAACVCKGIPEPRVLVISPRKLVQNAWLTEGARFSKYVLKEPRLSLQAAFHESLRKWLAMATTPGIHLIRHSSFTRPIYNSTGSWLQALSTLEVPEELGGILERECPRETGDNGRDYNLALARGVNKWLKAQGISFDLILVDEAQCLRNQKNQTNSVFQALLNGLGKNWLFMSATPAHSGVRNIATVLNEYPGQGPIIAAECVNDLSLMRSKLKDYMIRRPRLFFVDGSPIHKSHYRLDDEKSLKLHCQDPLSTLSIALVQNYLSTTLGKEGGRFRSGFIASFESLEDSLLKRGAPRQKNSAETEEEEEDESGTSDFPMEHHYSAEEPCAPDETFVNNISRDFLKKFGIGLPHPKLDGVETDLALKAYGDPDAGDPGGIKSVVFCRRLSSVWVLRERLIRRYLESVQARCERVWNVKLDWDRMMTGQKNQAAEKPKNIIDTPAAGHVEWDDKNRVRQAHSEGEWLYKFRMTFADGRNALVLELNWFERLCRETGLSVQTAASRVPESVWAQSQALATHGSKRHRAEQARWLVWLALDQCALSVFDFDEARALAWKTVLRPILGIPDVIPLVEPQKVVPEMELLQFRSLWTLVEESGDTAMHLPGARPNCDLSQMYWRKIVATVIGQYMRLTDTAIDMYFADEPKTAGSLQGRFAAWLLGADPDAVRFRQIWKDWVAHHVLIFSAAIGEQADTSPDELARKDAFDFLNNLDPVVGITGGTGGHKRSLQQFNTPGMPFVMIGTDTIREGVNLHLFCDRVMHYGMPWTPGDMEQRIGRVDRYFGKIERRLNAKADSNVPPKLQILYPHLQDTVELQQIRTVMHRRRQSEAVTEGSLGGDSKGQDEKFVMLDAVLVPDVEPLPQAPRDNFFDVTRHLKT